MMSHGIHIDRRRVLEMCVSVVETGSFAAADRDLHIGQPAVSKAIAGVEDRWVSVCWSDQPADYRQRKPGSRSMNVPSAPSPRRTRRKRQPRALAARHGVLLTLSEGEV